MGVDTGQGGDRTGDQWRAAQVGGVRWRTSGRCERTFADALVSGSAKTKVRFRSLSLGGRAVSQIGAMWSLMICSAANLSSASVIAVAVPRTTTDR